MNNYICQNDGTNVTAFKGTGKTAGGNIIDGTTYKATMNTYYSGKDGVLVYAADGIVANSQVDVKWTAHYEKDQGSLTANNPKTAADSLDTKIVEQGETITSVFAEDFGSITVKNYRNIDGVDVVFHPECNYIIGENNLGKSNFLLRSCFGIDGIDGQLIIVTHSTDALVGDYRNLIRFYKTSDTINSHNRLRSANASNQSSGDLNDDTMLSIMMEQKKPEKTDVTLAAFRFARAGGLEIRFIRRLAAT